MRATRSVSATPPRAWDSMCTTCWTTTASPKARHDRMRTRRPPERSSSAGPCCRVATLCVSPLTSEGQLDERAREILENNDRGGYTVPNGRVYPFQWNWDSAFVAFGFAAFNPERAWREIETLFEAQWEDG